MSSPLLTGTADGIRRLGSDAVDLANHNITALAPRWALADGRSLWRLAGPEGPVLEARIDALPPATFILPLDGSFLVGTAEAHMARLEPGGVRTLEGFEHGGPR